MDEDFDEPFIGGVDAVSDDDNDTACIGHISTLSPLSRSQGDLSVKKKDRKSKAEYGKKENQSVMRPSGAIRISLTPKPKGRRGRPPGSKNKKDTDVKAVKGLIAAQPSATSPFPVVEDKKSLPAGPGRPRGRPRMHPPKELKEKKPLGRPRTKLIEGEKAWRAECARLNRIIKKKDALISQYKQKLSEVGIDLNDFPEATDLVENEDIANGSTEVDQCAIANGQLSIKKSDNDCSNDIDLTCRRMEDTHQTYVEMFANDGCQSDSDGNEMY